MARYYHADGNGNTRAITDAAGAVVERYDYDAFGSLRNTPTGAVSNDRRYTGEQHDGESGYTFLRARYYDPALGRFISKDPFDGVKQDPQSLNGYIYVQNRPVNYADPSGKFCAGALGGGTIEAGIIAVGGAMTGSVGGGACFDFSDSADVGIFAAAGAVAGSPTDSEGFPEGEGNGAAGFFAGLGLGPFISNAESIDELEGPFETVSIDLSVSFIPVKASFQFSWSGDIWVASMTFGPREGVGASKLWTDTGILWDND